MLVELLSIVAPIYVTMVEKSDRSPGDVASLVVLSTAFSLVSLPLILVWLL